MQRSSKQFQEMLSEISKVSAMKATTALSKFLKTPLGLEFKQLEVVDTQHIQFGITSNIKTVCLYSGIKGNVVGCSFLLYTQAAALSICEILLNKKNGSTKVITEVEQSALTELANILIGNFLTSFSQSLLTSSLLHRPAIFECDVFAKIQDNMRAFVEQMGLKSAIKIAFDYQSTTFKGTVFFIFEAEKINSMLKDLFVISNG